MRSPLCNLLASTKQIVQSEANISPRDTRREIRRTVRDSV